MTQQEMKALVSALENQCFHLELAVNDTGDDPGRLLDAAQTLQRALDEAQFRLDALRDTDRRRADEARGAYRELAGNIFRDPAAFPPAQALCTDCGRYWAPAGQTICARCADLRNTGSPNDEP